MNIDFLLINQGRGRFNASNPSLIHHICGLHVRLYTNLDRVGLVSLQESWFCIWVYVIIPSWIESSRFLSKKVDFLCGLIFLYRVESSWVGFSPRKLILCLDLFITVALCLILRFWFQKYLRFSEKQFIVFLHLRFLEEEEN